MSQTTAFGLLWDEAEVGVGRWQGVRALNFTDPTPPGLSAELRVQLIVAANGLAAGDISVFGPDGTARSIEVSVADGDTVVLVQFAVLASGQERPGQHALRLLSGGADPLHPFFTEAMFDFYVDCPAGDCRPEQNSHVVADVPEPSIDLATKDYRGFLQVAQDWARATDPNWSDLSPASVEGTLIELLAHHAEMLSIHQDRVAQEAFIETARERISLTRHARFLGLNLEQGATAQSVIVVDIDAAEAGYLPAGTPIERLEAAGRVTTHFETTEAAFLDPRWNAGLADLAAGNGLMPAAWPGAADAVFPKGTKGMLLWGKDKGLFEGQRVALMQGGQTHIARIIGLREIKAAGWVSSPSDPPTTAEADLTEIVWQVPTEVVFSPWSDRPGLPFLISANIVDALHGETRRASNNPTAGVIGLKASRQDAVFASDPVTGELLLRALRTPEDSVLMAQGTPPRPAVSLAVADEPFSWQPNLRSSAGFDRHFTTEREEDGSVWLIFGDGVRGRAIPAAPGAKLPSDTLSLSYRRGDPAAGNIGAFALNAVGRFPAGDTRNAEVANLAVSAVSNVTAATDGRRAVSLDVARQLIAESIRHPALERCVTLDDYRRAAETVPGVARAAVKSLGGLFNTLVVLVAPEQGEVLAPGLAQAVWQQLDRLRMAGREHVVRAPDYLALELTLLICPAAGADAASVRAQARAALVPGSAERPGFFHHARIGFGAEIRLTAILAAVQAQPAVGAVRALAFRSIRDASRVQLRRSIRLGPTEIALFAGDEARPDRGRLILRVEGSDPPRRPSDVFVVGGPEPELSIGAGR